MGSQSAKEEISAHDRKLACEVITEVHRLNLDGTDEDCAAIMHARWPARDNGGVSHANRRTFARVQRALQVIAEEQREADALAWEAIGENRYSEYAP